MSTAEKIKVMQAYLEGKQLQVRYHGHPTWGDHADPEPLWDWRIYDYRIKPSVRFKVFISGNGTNWVHVSSFHLKDDADQYGKLLLKQIGCLWEYYKVEEEEK